MVRRIAACRVRVGRSAAVERASFPGSCCSRHNPTYIQLDVDRVDVNPEQRKLSNTVAEFRGYIRTNATWIPNYGERYRAGEVTSSAFVESAVNQVVGKRMVKKQHMRWIPRGAHLLLQVRTRVLNDDLADDFHRWHPGLRRTLDPMTLAA